MSTDTSVPQPRVSGLDVSDSALLATLLREAPIGFAFFGPDLRVRRINQTPTHSNSEFNPNRVCLRQQHLDSSAKWRDCSSYHQLPGTNCESALLP